MPETALSQMLRHLRRHRHGRPVLQARVAEALGLTVPSISSYENGTTVPPPDRLRDFALFFATPRWLDPGSPGRVFFGFLLPDEVETFTMLTDELEMAARADKDPVINTVASPPPFWRFPDSAPIRIFCGYLGDDEAGPFGDPENANFMALRRAADLDSLVELWGILRRLNPDSDVRWVLGKRFSAEDLSSHMIVVGNIAQRQGAGLLIPEQTLPVHQVPVEDMEGEPFEFAEADHTVRVEPRTEDSGKVVEDVGLIARRSNPHDSRRLLTVCSGVFTRGVFGAARSLTDSRLRDANAEFLRDTVDLQSFAILFRVRVAGDAVVTPELRGAVLHSFSPLYS